MLLQVSCGLLDMVEFDLPASNRKTGGSAYVYMIANQDGKPGYIGKGTGRRMFAHEKESENPSNRSHKCAAIRRERGLGRKVFSFKIATGLTNVEAFALEAELIDCIGLGNLWNVVPGGENGFTNLPKGYRQMVLEARAKMAQKQAKTWVATRYVQHAVASHPFATRAEIKAILIARGEPWEAGRKETKNKNTMLNSIHVGGQEMRLELGLNGDALPENKRQPDRLFVTKMAIAHPDWTARECAAAAVAAGLTLTRTDLVPPQDMLGVYRAYCTLKVRALLKKDYNPVTLEAMAEAPPANVDQEGLSTQAVQPAVAFLGNFGHNGGPVWLDAD